MLRLALTLALVFILAGLVAWLSIQPGDLVATWRGTRFSTSAATALVLAVLVLIVAVLIPIVIARLARTPARFRAGRAARRRDRGYAAVSNGLVAVAAGDAEAARRQTRKARGLLDDAPLVLLLSAQAAQLDGDNEAAERAFHAMLERPETEFLGLRGLVVQALRRGDRQAAQPLLIRAHAIRPKAPWILASQFDLACAAGEWPRAETLLDEMKRAGVLDDHALRRRRVVLFSAWAQDAETAGRGDSAREFAQRANRLDAAFTPAALILARRLAAGGNKRKAEKILHAAWLQFPHPALAAAFWDLEPAETAAARLERTRRLTEGASDARESRLAVAEQAIAAGDFAAARAALAPLDHDTPTVRVCAMRAVLAQSAGAEAEARDWLVRAGQAPREPLWLCRQCGHEAPGWSAICPTCGVFDSQAWLAPAESTPAWHREAAISGALLLPARPPSGAEEADAAVDSPAEILPHAPDDPGPDADTTYAPGAAHTVHRV